MVVVKRAVQTQRVPRQVIDAGTVTREDDSMTEGETRTVRPSRDGVRDVTYKKFWRNGEVVRTTVVKSRVLRAPVDAIVRVGTKPAAARDHPPPASAAAASGTPSPRASRAATGRPTPATATTAALQFSLGTWQAYGGSGLPSANSREQQIAIAERGGGGRGRLRRLAALRGRSLTASTLVPVTTSSAGPRLLGPAEVRLLADGLDLRPTKQKGQNFVIDPTRAADRARLRHRGRRRRARGRSRPGGR